MKKTILFLVSILPSLSFATGIYKVIISKENSHQFGVDADNIEILKTKNEILVATVSDDSLVLDIEIYKTKAFSEAKVDWQK